MPALLAWSLWCAFVALLQATGGLARIADDVPFIAAFAAAFALLAYVVDAELRFALEALGGAVLTALAAALVAASVLGPAWALLAALPAGSVMATAAAARPFAARFSSAAAASPGATRGGP